MRAAALDLGKQNEGRGQQKRAIEGMKGKCAGVRQGKPDLRDVEDQRQTCPPAETTQSRQCNRPAGKDKDGQPDNRANKAVEVPGHPAEEGLSGKEELCAEQGRQGPG